MSSKRERPEYIRYKILLKFLLFSYCISQINVLLYFKYKKYV